MSHSPPRAPPMPMPCLFLSRPLGFGTTAENSFTHHKLKENHGTFISLYWNDGNIIHNPYKVGKFAMEPKFNTSTKEVLETLSATDTAAILMYILSMMKGFLHRAAVMMETREAQQESLRKQASRDPGSCASGCGLAQSPFHMGSAPEVNLIMTSESFSKLVQRIEELVESLRRQMKEEKYFGINPTAATAALANG
ncbi:hypothetical protein RUND412_008994 [Rhizina undulata]